MIPLSELKTLAEALPKASITEPAEGYSWILDTNGAKIGAVHWDMAQITLFTDYEHIDLVAERIGNEIGERDIEFVTPDEPVDTSGDEPELTDYGRQLYGAEKR